MISRLETMDGLPIPQDPFALRIVSAGQSYGLNTPFLDIWQGNGLLISRMDRAVTLAGMPEEESMEETRLFLAACGGETVLCSRETAACFPEFSIQTEGPVLVRQQPGKRPLCPVSFPLPGCCIRCFPPVKVRLSRCRSLNPSIWTPLTGCVMGRRRPWYWKRRESLRPVPLRWR